MEAIGAEGFLKPKFLHRTLQLQSEFSFVWVYYSQESVGFRSGEWADTTIDDQQTILKTIKIPEFKVF